MEGQLNTLGLAHDFLRRRVKPGDFCIDATAGRGRDTVFLSRLAAPSGRVLAMDIQPQAVEATRALLAAENLEGTARVVLDGHENIDAYAAPGSVDAIVFNLGWLPGGDHGFGTKARTTILALEKSLGLLRPGGVISLCIYYGGASGYEERDEILAWLETVDPRGYTVLVTRFANRTGDPPIPVFIIKG